MTEPAPVSPGHLAQLACVLEASARKPGNVHRFRDFSDCTYLDFVLSASAIVPALDRAGVVGVGAAVRDAVRATRAVVATNTNLGMVLLLAPMAAVPAVEPLETGVPGILGATGINDTRLVYEAVRLAQPGGLGNVAEQDIAAEPTVPLLDAMRLAADRDSVARQYASGFADVFRVALPTLSRFLDTGRPLETAIVATHLTLLATIPDTLIARKRGIGEASEASRRAAGVIAAGWPDTARGRNLCRAFDDWLRADGHRRNPGASADLVAAALYAALRDGTIHWPIVRWDGNPFPDGDGAHHRVAFSPERFPVPVTRYKVRVEKDYLVFCAGHFITYAGDQCERIHGHNYRVSVEVEDDLDENHYVFDFIALKDLTRDVTDTLDHRMLLPTRNARITLAEDGPNWLVRYGERRWSFPRDECVLLPIANTTAELLARFIGERLQDLLTNRTIRLPRVLRIEVEECFGQSAEVEWVHDS